MVEILLLFQYAKNARVVDLRVKKEPRVSSFKASPKFLLRDSLFFFGAVLLCSLQCMCILRFSPPVR